MAGLFSTEALAEYVAFKNRELLNQEINRSTLYTSMVMIYGMYAASMKLVNEKNNEEFEEMLYDFKIKKKKTVLSDDRLDSFLKNIAKYKGGKLNYEMDCYELDEEKKNSIKSFIDNIVEIVADSSERNASITKNKLLAKMGSFAGNNVVKFFEEEMRAEIPKIG